MFQDDIGQTADSDKKGDTDELVGGHRKYSLFTFVSLSLRDFWCFLKPSILMGWFGNSGDIEKLETVGFF